MVSSNLGGMLGTQELLLMGITETPSSGRALERETETRQKNSGRIAALLALNSAKSKNWIALHVFLQENIFKPVVKFIPQIFLLPPSHSQYFPGCVVIKIGVHSIHRTKPHAQKPRCAGYHCCRTWRAIRLAIELKAQTRIPMEELVSLDNEKVGRAPECLSDWAMVWMRHPKCSALLTPAALTSWSCAWHRQGGLACSVFCWELRLESN